MKAKGMACVLVVVGLILLLGCTTYVDIRTPHDRDEFGINETVNLVAELRTGGYGCGGDRCGCINWEVRKDGAPLTVGNPSFPDYCVFRWAIPASNIGPGAHTLEVSGSDPPYYRRNSDSITITVIP